MQDVTHEPNRGKLQRADAAPATITVEGWPLDEPRIPDLILAARLGYERPDEVRDIIERLEVTSELGAVRASAGREYVLTEAQALKVIAKADTSEARAILDDVIRVFMLARRGLLAEIVAQTGGAS